MEESEKRSWFFTQRSSKCGISCHKADDSCQLGKLKGELDMFYREWPYEWVKVDATESMLFIICWVVQWLRYTGQQITRVSCHSYPT